MAQINGRKGEMPFTYTGTWNLYDWDGGTRWYAEFLTSGTLSPKHSFWCDAFLVGGGGSGGRILDLDGSYLSNNGHSFAYGGGGGGGRTSNYYDISVDADFSVTIGAGSVSNSTGGTSSFGDGSRNASGGNSAAGISHYDYISTNWNHGAGADGGSGGGTGGRSGATNGGNSPDSLFVYATISGGKGQGVSTRPFWDSNNASAPWNTMQFGGGGGGGLGGTSGTSVTSGGDGGGGFGARSTMSNNEISSISLINATNGVSNTGGGGGGGAFYWYYNYNSQYINNAISQSGNGGSGIVIIRGAGADAYLNKPPTTPDGITYPSVVNAGKQATIATGGSTDPEGDSITYVWEHRADSGVYDPIGKTTGLSIEATIPTVGETWQARVKAADSKGAESGWTTGPAVPINYNNEPTISGEDTDIGAHASPVSYSYTVDDVDEGDILAVTESIVTGGAETPLRAFTAARGVSYTADTAPVWIRLLDGAHTLKIHVDDGNGGIAERLVAFSRTISRISGRRSVATDTLVTKCLLSMFPATPAAMRAEVCNNPFDAAPVWEDVSNKLGTRVHFFENTASEHLGFAMRFYILPTQADTSVSLFVPRISGEQ